MEAKMVTVRDRLRTVHGLLAASTLNVLIAALSADPETISELWVAMGRFDDGAADRILQSLCQAGSGPRRGELDDAWLCVDLPARLLVGMPSSAAPLSNKTVPVYAACQGRTVQIPFHLSSCWAAIAWQPDWSELAEQRRQLRWQRLGRDTRHVLYGRPLLEFLIDASENEPASARAIHARWLTTPRADLQGRTPRQVLLNDLRHLECDLDDRQLQWSCTLACPRPIDRASHAYQQAEVGPHEFLVYFWFVRYLIGQLTQCAHKPQAASTEQSSDRRHQAVVVLQHQAQMWLDTPQPDLLHGYSPRAVVDMERQRIPLTADADRARDWDPHVGDRLQEALNGPCFVLLSEPETVGEFEFSKYETDREFINGRCHTGATYCGG